MEKIKTDKEIFDSNKELAQKLLEFVKNKPIQPSGGIMDYNDNKIKLINSVPSMEDFVDELRKKGDIELANFIEVLFK